MLVTDRWRWQNQVLGARALSQSTVGGDWRGIWSAGFNSSLVVFIEDRLSLVPTLGIQYRSYDDPAFDDHQSEQWTWNVELALEYQIGQGLY